jgi:hypothetical protein
MHIATRQGSRIILDLAFVDDAQASGGKSRSVQLLEIFICNGFSTERIDRPARPGKWSLLWKAIQGILKFGIYPPLCADSLRTTGVNYHTCRELVRRYPDVKVYVLEGTGFGQMQVVSILRHYNKEVILVPANLESLSPYESWTHRIDVHTRFGAELKHYRRANSIFCISPEETWLLRVMSCTAFFLPYRPPDSLMARILKRRDQHSLRRGEGLFYFANFRNAPNVLGLKNFLEENKHKGKTIRIAGLGIENVTPLLKGHSEFQILGELSDEQLEHEIISAKGIILNHFPTAGMLTRVPELLMSGIALEANFDALKSYSLVPPVPESGTHLGALSAQAEAFFISRVISLLQPQKTQPDT